ncbi:CBS domain-containing protein [Candidatus Contubernalis alkaliaceticus]|uniref:CBS domain-containing protein n=1 Tax=Candidatus Contubernalis alkaliaceticus TaxID=338645 RepID=UPI001F4BD643|nr:CBS domain-containing protein [Candidatus Contubernalis alkalaceticus]UNC92999.1 CBS domain-containing protein [Candidatus Contubernalis alkalaceticus]
MANIRRKVRTLPKRVVDQMAKNAEKNIHSRPVSLKEDVTVQEALDRVRNSGKKVKIVYALFITDDGGKLKGYLTLKDLIAAAPEMTVHDLMDEMRV